MTPTPHIWPIRVYIEDTDMGGIVYHANYLKFTERARTEWLREAGASHASMIDDGVMFLVKRLQIDYHHPAKLDDMLDIHTSVSKIGNASVDIVQNIHCGDRLIASSDLTLVCVNKAGKPCRIPDDVRGKM